MVHLVKNILLGLFLQILIERQLGVELTLEHLDMIEDPYICKREQWLYSLLGAQFKLNEMKSGYAYEFLKDEK